MGYGPPRSSMSHPFGPGPMMQDPDGGYDEPYAERHQYVGYPPW